MQADGRARDLLSSPGEPRDVLASLRARSGEVGAAVDAYVEAVGYRLANGLDVGEPYTLEMPEVLLQAIRSVVNPPTARPEADVQAAATAGIRDAVPAAHRDAFDDLLMEARRVYRLRDERGIFCDIWAYGLARRAMVAAGARLVGTGRLARATDQGTIRRTRSARAGADVP